MTGRRPARIGLAVVVALVAVSCDGPRDGAGSAGVPGTAAASQGGPAAVDEGTVGRVGSYGIEVAVNRKVFNPGDTIRMRLSAYNETGEPLLLHFATAQRFDFLLRRGDDGLGAEPVWRWSRDRFFAQSEGVERLTPERPRLEYSAAVPAPGEPGIYLVVGRVTAAKWPISATVPITVTP